MSPGVATIPVSEAAVRLGVSASTVRNHIQTGLLAAVRGEQPIRRRYHVWVDAEGRPVNPLGEPVTPSLARPADSELAAVIARLDALEARLDDRPSAEAYRDAALQLHAAMERQRRALELQLQASQELNAAVSEQGAVIAGLLIGDPTAALEGIQSSS